MGKGDHKRPRRVPMETWDKNFEDTFKDVDKETREDYDKSDGLRDEKLKVEEFEDKYSETFKK